MLSRRSFRAFELDVRAGELWKRGRKILLREQPFQVLLMLLERPGDVVLLEEIRKRLEDQPFQVLLAFLEKPGDVVIREELRGRLWPADTSVDLRPRPNCRREAFGDALGDTPENPHLASVASKKLPHGKGSQYPRDA